MKIQHPLLLLLFIVLSMNAYPAIYRCKDNAGRLITSDRIMPECADKVTQVYTDRGVLRHQLPGALTDEQRHANKLHEQQRIKQIQQQIQQQKEIRYLTTHYPNVQDIDFARQKELDAVDAKIAEEKKAIAINTEALTKNRHEQARLLKLPKNPRNDLLKTRVEEEQLLQTIQQSKRMTQHYQLEKTNINRQFNETRKRYLEIVGPSNK